MLAAADGSFDHSGRTLRNYARSGGKCCHLASGPGCMPSPRTSSIPHCPQPPMLAAGQDAPELEEGVLTIVRHRITVRRVGVPVSVFSRCTDELKASLHWSDPTFGCGTRSTLGRSRLCWPAWQFHSCPH